MARKPFIAGNWKMNKTAAEAVTTAKEIIAGIQGLDKVDAAVCPTLLSLVPVVEAAKGTNLGVGSQNMHFAESGAYTGEVSATMIKESGAGYVIIGHSERRQYFGETDETVNQRTIAVLNAGLTPLTCIGETLAERESGNMENVLGTQLKGGLAGFTNAQMEKTVIAYEPVWAIGTGVTASPEQAQAAHAFIRKTLTEMFGTDTAEKIIIQYGGSVKAGNVAELIGQKDIDGALVGGASLKSEDFVALLTAANNAL